jgi:hypothetical protein
VATAKASKVPAERIERYDRLIATVPGTVRKGATIPYTSVNGRMVSYLTETGSLVLRLPAPDRERFLTEYGATLHEAYGIVQKEFVDVPDELFAATERVAPWFAAATAHGASQKPKPTTRRR